MFACDVAMSDLTSTQASTVSANDATCAKTRESFLNTRDEFAEILAVVAAFA